jgi:8-oxo-dGTP pyrophosphatase MutT (NUDIX family)
MKIKQLKVIASDTLHQQTLDETGYWGKAGAGCLVYCKENKKFLFAHRSAYVLEPNTYGMFGGAIDPNENPLKAALRELKEEAGYTGKTESKLINVFKDTKVGFIFYNYLVIIEKEFTPKLDWESQGYKWCSFNKWPTPTHPKVKIMLSSNSDKIKKLIEQL